jgi:hypothetical protein
MAAVRAFLERIAIQPWEAKAAEAHAQIRAQAKRLGRSAGVFDIMIAAHAAALGLTLVTSDAAIESLKNRRAQHCQLVDFGPRPATQHVRPLPFAHGLFARQTSLIADKHSVYRGKSSLFFF